MNTEAKVGTFVVVCLILLSVTVYYVGNEQWGRHLTPYKTYLRYAGGVAPGTEVLFGGISVGHQRIRNYLDRGRIAERPSPDGVKRLRLGDLLAIQYAFGVESLETFFGAYPSRRIIERETAG